MHHVTQTPFKEDKLEETEEKLKPFLNFNEISLVTINEKNDSIHKENVLVDETLFQNKTNKLELY